MPQERACSFRFYRSVAVLWSFVVFVLVSYCLISNCARTVRIRRASRSACTSRAHFWDLIATPWRSLIPLFSPSLPVRYRMPCSSVGSNWKLRFAHERARSSIRDVSAYSRDFCFSAFRRRALALRVCAATAGKDYVSQIGISRRLASTERQRQVRTWHFAESVFKCSQHTRCNCTVVSSNAIPWQAICFVRK
jgi:hypothetical protein